MQDCLQKSVKSRISPQKVIVMSVWPLLKSHPYPFRRFPTDQLWYYRNLIRYPSRKSVENSLNSKSSGARWRHRRKRDRLYVYKHSNCLQSHIWDKNAWLLFLNGKKKETTDRLQTLCLINFLFYAQTDSLSSVCYKSCYIGNTNIHRTRKYNNFLEATHKHAAYF